eukprot:comp22178_c0_seq1/m.52179 comp22178_c0_seq1/g.52179  ORF comp22178_c0_seq1/g.52179 comp22178_c0_seq1/m.52179 type:complete len:343 (-) comp22178_c0_seq1:1777-2805(-)
MHRLLARLPFCNRKHPSTARSRFRRNCQPKADCAQRHLRRVHGRHHRRSRLQGLRSRHTQHPAHRTHAARTRKRLLCSRNNPGHRNGGPHKRTGSPRHSLAAAESEQPAAASPDRVLSHGRRGTGQGRAQRVQSAANHAQQPARVSRLQVLCRRLARLRHRAHDRSVPPSRRQMQGRKRPCPPLARQAHRARAALRRIGIQRLHPCHRRSRVPQRDHRAALLIPARRTAPHRAFRVCRPRDPGSARARKVKIHHALNAAMPSDLRHSPGRMQARLSTIAQARIPVALATPPHPAPPHALRQRLPRRAHRATAQSRRMRHHLERSRAHSAPRRPRTQHPRRLS